jgi:hypothetical protein
LDTIGSAQHLSVPTSGRRLNRYSDGNLYLSQSNNVGQHSNNIDEQLLDPRLIPNSVRRSLLALHRESQDNIHMHRIKEQTRSENDVHGAFTPWKIKMKSKLKRTHHAQQTATHEQSQRRTFSILPARYSSNDQQRRVSEYATINREYRFSTPPPRNASVSMAATYRRTFKHRSHYSTQSENEHVQVDPSLMTNIYVSIDDDNDGDNNNDHRCPSKVQH